MIRKLRRNFVLIMMSIVTVILLAVFFAVLRTTQINIERNSMSALHMAMRDIPRRDAVSYGSGPDKKDGDHNGPPGIRTPTVLLRVDADGEAQILQNRMVYMEDSDILAVADIVSGRREGTGVLTDYSLRYLREQAADGGVHIALADISMERHVLTDLIINSLMIGACAFALFFFLSIFLARWAVRPVQKAWDHQRQFVADASHELKTPLTVILSNADMMAASDGVPGEKNATRLENIRSEGLRMKRLIGDMLELARADSAQASVTHSPVDFSDTVMSSILLFEPSIYDGGKHLEYELADGLNVLGDADRLRQVVDILLDNARKYSAEGGRIAVHLAASGKKQVVLTVRNQGDPIPPDELTEIFRRFYRVDKSRNNSGGFGLGLSIARSIVEEHSGKICATGDGKQENTFSVTLPLAR